MSAAYSHTHTWCGQREVVTIKWELTLCKAAIFSEASHLGVLDLGEVIIVSETVSGCEKKFHVIEVDRNHTERNQCYFIFITLIMAMIDHAVSF